MNKTTTPAERPILMSTPMVQAIIAGRKTQTRRVINPQPNNPNMTGGNPIWGYGVMTGTKNLPKRHWPTVSTRKDPWNYFGVHCATNVNGKRVDQNICCPFGKAGDLLWVRETFAYVLEDKLGIIPDSIIYKADGNEGWEHGWKPSIFMPKEAARIWLQLESIRVERLQTITEQDAIAEGITEYEDGTFKNYYKPISIQPHLIRGSLFSSIGSYQSLWDSINGKPATGNQQPADWKSNPYVWVLTYKVLSTTGRNTNQ